ncbi:HAMP domain-containing histidine kinase [Planctomonas sp. JC2975]|uniref:sensor histidine kinase n=1 Tax=Planctomonas sp. JC2975 TaxID=2729626 RepID=UPI00147490DB|nr:HAMP domain-containing sensor histidine kinase [Planctomonas sp. JC2975]NNC10985.1 HAMP domain-containing histidine kinase [Planctomonas sp. JC2975]
MRSDRPSDVRAAGRFRLLPRTLVGRIVFTTVIVAVVAVVVAGAVSFGLVRTASLGDARTVAASLADELATLPQSTLDRRAAEAPTGSGQPKIAVIEPSGTVVGSVGVVLRPKVQKKLATGSTLSTTIDIGGHRYIVEARPTSAGGTVVVARSVASVDAQVSAVAGQLVVALLIGLAIALAAGFLLARAVSRPLSRTAGAARRLAAGERNVELPQSGTVEVSDVVDALAELDTALTVSEARQREFLLSISHDLRTPLTAVRGYAEALADSMIRPDELRDVGSTMLAETRRLDRFVADLLELARLEAHDFPLELGPVDVAAVLAEAAAAWRAVAESGGVALTTTVPSGLVAGTDAHRLRQVIDGLLENALRATPAGGFVTITARPDLPKLAPSATSGGVRITVADSGPGLTASDRDVAFERGALHGRYRDSRPVGTGLGLSIAQRLTARLGGELRVVAPRQDAPAGNTAATGGAAFELVLPAAAAPSR